MFLLVNIALFVTVRGVRWGRVGAGVSLINHVWSIWVALSMY